MRQAGRGLRFDGAANVPEGLLAAHRPPGCGDHKPGDVIIAYMDPANAWSDNARQVRTASRVPEDDCDQQSECWWVYWRRLLRLQLLCVIESQSVKVRGLVRQETRR